MSQSPPPTTPTTTAPQPAAIVESEAANAKYAAIASRAQQLVANLKSQLAAEAGATSAKAAQTLADTAVQNMSERRSHVLDQLNSAISARTADAKAAAKATGKPQGAVVVVDSTGVKIDKSLAAKEEAEREAQQAAAVAARAESNASQQASAPTSPSTTTSSYGSSVWSEDDEGEEKDEDSEEDHEAADFSALVFDYMASDFEAAGPAAPASPTGKEEEEEETVVPVGSVASPDSAADRCGAVATLKTVMASQATTGARYVVYGAEWCCPTRAALDKLHALGMPYQFINIGDIRTHAYDVLAPLISDLNNQRTMPQVYFIRSDNSTINYVGDQNAVEPFVMRERNAAQLARDPTIVIRSSVTPGK